MAVLRKSKSGKVLQVVLGNETFEPGTVLQVPVSIVQKMIDKQYSYSFFVMSKMSMDVPKNKFPNSPLYGAEGLISKDPMSGKIVDIKKLSKSYNEDNVPKW